MSVVARKLERLKGIAEPRRAPPEPLIHMEKQFVATARSIGIRLYPWQRVAARYITALRPDGRWLYREVAIIVARQNGKTELLKPLIYGRLLDGRRIMHSAQNRDLPRVTHEQLADIVETQERLLATRNGRPRRPRFANGQEEIRMANGGLYRIVAPTRSGARGPSNDDLIVDELREMWDTDFMAAAKPTLAASDNGQTIYLSNAGTEASVVLNGLQARADGEDPSLAYLEWSADPDLADDDVEGWRQANPAIGHKLGQLDTIADEHRAARLGGTMPDFETEYLCRGVPSMQPPLVSDAAWQACRVDRLDAIGRPAMGVAADPSGTRLSAVLAWKAEDGSVICQMAHDLVDPVAIDVGVAGKDLRQISARNRVRDIGFSTASDQAVARHLPRAKALDGRAFANACGSFANLVDGHQLRWAGEDLIGQDLKYLRRHSQADGTSVAIKAEGGPPVTAALAAIRAVWLATAPRQVPRVG